MDELYFAMGALFLASCLQGIIGFGAGMLSMSLLTLFWPVAYSTAVLNPLGLVVSSSLVWRQRRDISLTEIKPLISGLPFGVFIGLMALTHLSDRYLKLMLGVTLFIAVLNALWRGTRSTALPMVYAWLAGFFSGICGVSVSSAGPPTLIYATIAGWDKTLFRANLSAFFLSASTLACLGLASKGLLTTETLKVTAYFIPIGLIGSKLGFHLGQRVPQTLFTRFTLALLTILALRFIVMSFT